MGIGVGIRIADPGESPVSIHLDEFTTVQHKSCSDPAGVENSEDPGTEKSNGILWKVFFFLWMCLIQSLMYNFGEKFETKGLWDEKTSLSSPSGNRKSLDEQKRK